MDKGPSEVKPDYKNMWSNYSGWLQEAKSTFNKSSATNKAKGGASGISGVTPDIVSKNVLSTFEKEIGKIRGGVTGLTMKEYVQDKYFKDKVVGRLSTGTDAGDQFVHANFPGVPSGTVFGTGRDASIWDEQQALGRDAGRGATAITTGKTPIHERLGMTAETYARNATLFEKTTGSKPEPWEVYFTSKYGFTDSKFNPLTFGSDAEVQAKRLAGATIANNQSRSPWV